MNRNSDYFADAASGTIRNLSGNVVLREPYLKIMVYPALVVGPQNIRAFEQWVMTEFNTRIRYLEEIVTGSSVWDGRRDYSTAGRNDVFFAVHSDDIVSPSGPRRLARGMRWIDDILDTERRKLQSMYPVRIFEYAQQYADKKI